MELVKAFTLVIDLNPSVVCQVGENLILGLKAKLVAKLAARPGAKDVMLALLTARRLERALNIVKNAVSVQSTALEVPPVIERHADNLLVRFHLFDDLEVGPVEDLDVAQVEGDQNETIVSESVVDFEFARHFLLQLELIRREEV